MVLIEEDYRLILIFKNCITEEGYDTRTLTKEFAVKTWKKITLNFLKLLKGNKHVDRIGKTVLHSACSDTYDFLLVFHNNYGTISYHIPEKWQYLPRKNSTPVHLTAPLKGFPLEFVKVLGL